MVQISDIKLPYDYTKSDLYAAIAKRLRVPQHQISAVQCRKKSIDARKKPQIFAVLTVTVQFTPEVEQRILKRYEKDKGVTKYTPYHYAFPKSQVNPIDRPIVVGFGPAGMFAAYAFAKAGLHPIILERGAPIEMRTEDVALFRRTGKLNPDSNVQFGEGGAGTFSDGKLTTGIHDTRIRCVLETFVQYGAPEEILSEAKPHIGTDNLFHVVKNLRQAIQSLGGDFSFHAVMDRLYQENGQLTGISYRKDGKRYDIATRTCILAIGHSARDTFQMLFENQIPMIPKSFAVGVRIEHLQQWIDTAMYGHRSAPPRLPAASYKLAEHFPNDRSLYTFCMCPGGEVIAATSEKDCVVVNGMSEFSRGGTNANSALLVGVTPDDFGRDHPLAGVAFQRKLEHAAFLAGGGNYFAPACTVGDFLKGRAATGFGDVVPSYQPGVTLASPEEYLPEFITETLKCGIPKMARKLPRFDHPDAVLTGIESRSSSPVRILRGESYESISLCGLYPCGEGAGYAGGITSAGVDGLRCAEAAIQNISFS